MPITTHRSYLPTMQEFAAHWTLVNTELASDGPLVLSGPYTVASLIAAQTALEAAIDTILRADNARAGATANRDTRKAAAMTRLMQFRAAVQAFFPGTVYAWSLPRRPRFDTAESVFLAPFDAAADLWTQINALLPAPPGTFLPLTLAQGYTLAQFNADIAALRAVYRTVETGLPDGGDCPRSAGRAPPADKPRPHAVPQGRRRGSPARLGIAQEHPGVLPAPRQHAEGRRGIGRLGRITAQGRPDMGSVLQSAPRLLFHPNCAGSGIQTGERIGGRDDATTFATDAGLPPPGSVALYRVYVVVKTGNEKGSVTIKVTRPEG